MKHRLKVWKEFYPLAESGRKDFEIRKYDRDYQAGDTLELAEWDKDLHQFTGNQYTAQVDAVYRGLPGLEEGYCIMPTTRLPEPPK